MSLSFNVIEVNTAARVLEALRKTNPDMLASNWEVPGARAGDLLRRIIDAKPGMPTIAVIQAGSIEDELEARRLGVSVVLADDVDDATFEDAVCQVLGIKYPETANFLVCG